MVAAAWAPFLGYAPGVRSKWRRLRTAGGLCAALALASAGGCDDELPAFAAPPDVDAGADPGSDEDAGTDERAADSAGFGPGIGGGDY